MVSKERNKIVSAFDERTQDNMRGLRLSLGERGPWFHFESAGLS